MYNFGLTISIVKNTIFVVRLNTVNTVYICSRFTPPVQLVGQLYELSLGEKASEAEGKYSLISLQDDDMFFSLSLDYVWHLRKGKMTKTSNH